MNYDFEIKGKINAETIDDASGILTLILEDNNVDIRQLDVSYGDQSVAICKKK